MTAPAAPALHLHIPNDEPGIADLLFMTRVTGAQHDGTPHPSARMFCGGTADRSSPSPALSTANWP
ncbi:MAG: hypothetical protein ABI563_11580 [Specibacter sp.]